MHYTIYNNNYKKNTHVYCTKQKYFENYKFSINKGIHVLNVSRIIFIKKKISI